MVTRLIGAKQERTDMTATLERIVNQVKLLDRREHAEFLAWLADYELSTMDGWDREIERDSGPGGRLSELIGRARRDISEGRTKPLDEFLDNA